MRYPVIIAIIILIILSVGVGSLFGFLNFSLASHNFFHFCPISIIVGNSCLSGDVLFSINHHINGLKYLTLSIIVFDAWIFISFVIIFLILFSHGFISWLKSLSLFRFKGRNLTLTIKKKFDLYLKQLIYWIALHNKRDRFLAYSGA